MGGRPTILVFDSGLGGLTVYREIAAVRPDANFIYLADDAAFPYGALAEPALTARLVALFDEAIAIHKPDLAVIACNTASTIALPEVKIARVVPLSATAATPSIRWATRRAIAGAGSMKLTGQGAICSRRASNKG